MSQHQAGSKKVKGCVWVAQWKQSKHLHTLTPQIKSIPAIAVGRKWVGRDCWIPRPYFPLNKPIKCINGEWANIWVEENHMGVTGEEITLQTELKLCVQGEWDRDRKRRKIEGEGHCQLFSVYGSMRGDKTKSKRKLLSDLWQKRDFPIFLIKHLRGDRGNDNSWKRLNEM